MSSQLLKLKPDASLIQVKRGMTRAFNKGVDRISIQGRMLKSAELSALMRYYDNSGILADGYGVEYYCDGQTFQIYKKAPRPSSF